MRKKSIAISIFAAISLAGCNQEKSKFLELCETAIKDQLRSPSGYKRIDSKYEKNSLSPDQYIGKIKEQGKIIKKELTKSQMQALKDGTYKPADYMAIIEYDAPNAFGTPVRENSTCNYLSHSGNLDYVSKTSIKVNGKSLIDNVNDFVESAKKQYLEQNKGN